MRKAPFSEFAKIAHFGFFPKIFASLPSEVALLACSQLSCIQNRIFELLGIFALGLPNQGLVSNLA